ncbi:MAG: hypothetical protein K1X77_10710, partial [Bacteroidia bacterium]|nr:hypothetical protein [Bacteroidia bacterium]
SSKGVNQVQLYAKLLNAYSWHQLIKWFGFEKARTILREEAIQMVFPASYRQKLLNAKFLTTQALSDTDFTRVFVAENGTALKIEFINDVAFHYGDFVYHGKIKTDNPLNVLSNKLTALARNASKDYADILFLAQKFAFNWIEMFDAAKAKDFWVNEVSIANLFDQFDVKTLIQ